MVIDVVEQPGSSRFVVLAVDFVIYAHQHAYAGMGAQGYVHYSLVIGDQILVPR